MPPKAVLRRPHSQGMPQQVCSEHAMLRPLKFLVEGPPGKFRCLENSPCHSVGHRHSAQRGGAAAATAEDEERKSVTPPVQQHQDPATLASTGPPADGGATLPPHTGSSSGKAIVCDLCNGEVPERFSLQEHFDNSHPSLVKFCNSLEAEVPKSLKTAKTISGASAARFGAMVFEAGQQADKGPEEWKIVINAAKQINSILQRFFHGADVFMFGSCVALGTWDGKGDVDFTLVNPTLWEQNKWPPNEGNLVMSAARLLRDAGFAYEDLEPLARTRVPIVKHHKSERLDPQSLGSEKAKMIRFTFQSLPQKAVDQVSSVMKSGGCTVRWEVTGSTRQPTLFITCPNSEVALSRLLDPFDLLPEGVKIGSKNWAYKDFRPELFHVDFDLSARAHGIRNSHLLRAYMEQSPHVRVGSVFVKGWSKRTGVNNSPRGYITSYAVNLMWIYFLLQRGTVQFVDPSSIPMKPSASFKEIRYIPMIPPDTAVGAQKAKFQTELAALLGDFYRFYVVEFNWEENVISINSPHVKTKEEMKWTTVHEITDSKQFRDRVWYRLCIEDPFEENLNLGRHVSPFKMHKVMTEFIYAFQALVKGAPDLLLEDRCYRNAEKVMMQTVLRHMIGRREVPVEELTLELEEGKMLPWMAAVQTESKISKLLELCGMHITDTGTVRHRSEAHTFVPAQAKKIVEEIDRKLASCRALGVAEHTKSMDLNLRALFVFSNGRMFFDDDDKNVFDSHVKKMGDLLPMPLGALKKKLENILPRFEPLVLEFLTGAESPFFHVQRGIVQIRREEIRQSPICKKGLCDQCQRLTMVFPATDNKADPGVYCQECWNAFVPLA